MGVLNAIAGLGALVVALLGGGAVWVYDHHPPFGVHQKVLFWRVGFDLPDSLATQRDRALAASANAVRAGAQCSSDLAAMNGAVAAQNAAVEALQREGEARVARSLKAAQAARAVAESERQHALAILAAKPASADLCEAAGELIDEEASR